MNLDDLFEAWRVNNAVNLELLELCSEDTLEMKPGKGKTIRSNFVHIVSTRGMRIEEKASKLKEAVPKLDWKTATRDEIRNGLEVTEGLMQEVFRKRAEKPDRFSLLTFFAYMIAHEAHHRSQIEIALRINGAEFPDEKMFELWNWPKK